MVKQGHRLPLQRVQQREAAHPVPNQAGLAAGAEILNLAQRATERDLLLCLLSGGGSALLEALPDLLDLVALQATTEALLASGATIHEVNAVRKHLSQIKGGQLARAAAPATLVTLVLSDVVGSPLDVIASGPTVGDRSTWADVAEIVERYELASRLPTTVLAYLRRGIAGALPDTPQPDDPLFANNAVHLIGDNALLLAPRSGPRPILATKRSSSAPSSRGRPATSPTGWWRWGARCWPTGGPCRAPPV